MEKEEKARQERERLASEEEQPALLKFDEEAVGQMKSYLFGRESPDEESKLVPEEERADSPLGILEEGLEAKEVILWKKRIILDWDPIPPCLDF